MQPFGPNVVLTDMIESHGVQIPKSLDDGKYNLAFVVNLDQVALDNQWAFYDKFRKSMDKSVNHQITMYVDGVIELRSKPMDYAKTMVLAFYVGSQWPKAKVNRVIEKFPQYVVNMPGA